MTRFDHDVILEKRKGQTGAAAALQCNSLRRVRLSTEEALKWLISEKGDRLRVTAPCGIAHHCLVSHLPPGV